MKRLLVACLACAMLFTACSSPASSEEPSEAPAESSESQAAESEEGAELNIEEQYLTIGTASAGGAFYPIGTGIAEVITQYVEPLNVTAEITGGSVENPRLVATGEADMGVANADHATFAIEGSDPFDQVYDVSAVFSLHASVLHIVTTADSGITSIEDLAGERVAVGPAGGGSIPGLEAVLGAYGMTMEDIEPSYLSYDDGMAQLKDGQVKVALAMSGYPAASVMSLGATEEVVLISIPDDKMAAIAEANPYYSPVTIATDVYDTAAEATLLGVRNIIFCSTELSDDTVYAMTKAVYENLDELKTYHSALESVTQESMVDTSGIKMHPGAERYYTEIGAK